MLRIIIAGSRFFEDYNLFESTMFKVLFHLNKEYPQYNILVINKEERLFKINPCSLEIISGMAKGADTLAVRFANKYNLALKEFPADWNNLNVSPCANVPVGAVTLVILLAARTVIFFEIVIPSPKSKVYVWSPFVALSKSVLETVYVALSVEKVPLGVSFTFTSE